MSDQETQGDQAWFEGYEGTLAEEAEVLTEEAAEAMAEARKEVVNGKHHEAMKTIAEANKLEAYALEVMDEVVEEVMDEETPSDMPSCFAPAIPRALSLMGAIAS